MTGSKKTKNVEAQMVEQQLDHTLRAEMFGVVDFLLEIRVIIKISTHP